MKIGVIVAMDKEFVRMKELLRNQQAERRNEVDFVLGNITNHEIVLQKCGIGKVNAAIGATEMTDIYQPDLVISSGVAGGCNIELNPMDVVVSEACTYHDAYCGKECDRGQIMGMPSFYSSPEEMVEKAHAIEGKTRIKSGLIVSGDWFVDSKEKMREILNLFPTALAVDMESCAIAQTCHLRHTPFISFRIISDVPLKDHEAQQYYDFWNEIATNSFEVTKSYIEKI